jgi:hypothetical protein
MSLLKLRAQDSEDVHVISAVLQDAIVPVCDMVFQSDAKSFVMVVQRLRREAGEAGAAERICCALTIKGVKAVQTHGLDQKQQDRMLDLLAMMVEPTTAHMDLVFAGGARIRLELGDWFLAAEDFGEPWPALCNPCHEDAANSQSTG